MELAADEFSESLQDGPPCSSPAGGAWRRTLTVAGCVSSGFLGLFHTSYCPSVRAMGTPLGAWQRRQAGRKTPCMFRPLTMFCRTSLMRLPFIVFQVRRAAEQVGRDAVRTQARESPADSSPDGHTVPGDRSADRAGDGLSCTGSARPGSRTVVGTMGTGRLFPRRSPVSPGAGGDRARAVPGRDCHAPVVRQRFGERGFRARQGPRGASLEGTGGLRDAVAGSIPHRCPPRSAAPPRVRLPIDPCLTSITAVPADRRGHSEKRLPAC